MTVPSFCKICLVVSHYGILKNSILYKSVQKPKDCVLQIKKNLKKTTYVMYEGYITVQLFDNIHNTHSSLLRKLDAPQSI